MLSPQVSRCEGVQETSPSHELREGKVLDFACAQARTSRASAPSPPGSAATGSSSSSSTSLDMPPEFWVEGNGLLRLKVEGLVGVLGIRVEDLGVQSLGFRVQGSGLKV